MGSFSKFLQWVAGILLVISTAFQLLALIGGVLLSNNTIQEDTPWLVPAWIAALAALLLSFVLLRILAHRGRWPLLPLILAAVGALLALIVAMALKNAFPAQLDADGGTQGLTTWRLVYRHYSSVAVGVCTAIAALLQMLLNRSEQRRREEEEYKPAYDLSGGALFKDESTIGLEEYAGGEKPESPRKRKRSLRHAEKKAKEAARRL